MTLPRSLATVANHLSPLMGPFVSRAPTGAVLHHRGRRTGRSYNTPVRAFRTPHGYVVPLAYSRNAAWALNLLAEGGGEMTRGGRRYQLTQLRRTGPETRELLPARVSLMMRVLRIDDFLQFDATPLYERR
jgi:deazaflavin-dependent oxidoreductase (nitroreductase family)